MIFEYKGSLYPEYLKRGGGSRYIEPVALKFCQGIGIDVGCGSWPLPGAQGYDVNPLAHEDTKWSRADDLKIEDESLDYVFSSHLLEHLENPVKAIEHWRSKLKAGGVLFLYLPHPDMEYWLVQNCRKHLHVFEPKRIHKLLEDLGFINVLSSERDLFWSFTAVGFKPAN
jgi:SAM-dependent methyltransferase